MRVYYDNSVPAYVLTTLADNKVELFNMTLSPIVSKTMWRFVAVSAPSISRVCIRDTDSRLSLREKNAVDVWMLSDKKFHIMRDHPSHSRSTSHPMFAGMWCAVGKTIPDIQKMISQYGGHSYYAHDQDFLKDKIWPLARNNAVQHDSFSCDRYAGALPFPSPRNGDEHVGSVFIDGKLRDSDVNLLRKSVSPKACLPTNTNSFVVLSASMSANVHDTPYAVLLPLSARSWAAAGFTPIIVLVRHEPSPLEHLLIDDLRLIPSIILYTVTVKAKHTQISTSQIVRLFVSFLLPDTELDSYLRVSDADMIIYQSWPFNTQKTTGVHVYNGGCCQPQMPMHSIGMKVRLWRWLFAKHLNISEGRKSVQWLEEFVCTWLVSRGVDPLKPIVWAEKKWFLDQILAGEVINGRPSNIELTVSPVAPRVHYPHDALSKTNPTGSVVESHEHKITFHQLKDLQKRIDFSILNQNELFQTWTFTQWLSVVSDLATQKSSEVQTKDKFKINHEILDFKKCAKSVVEHWVEDEGVWINTFDKKDDKYISQYLQSGRGWEPDRWKALLGNKKIQPVNSHRPLFVDVGSNIGVFTLHAAGLGYDVIAVEGKPRNLQMLCSSIVRNNFTNIRLFHGAVWDSDQLKFDFTVTDPNNQGASQVKLSTSSDKTSVASFTLDYVLPASRPYIMKIDIESAECRAFNNAAFWKNPASELMMEWGYLKRNVGKELCPKPLYTSLVQNISRVYGTDLTNFDGWDAPRLQRRRVLRCRQHPITNNKTQKRLLITGCGFSATGFFAKVFTKVGIDIGHEKLGYNGESNWKAFLWPDYEKRFASILNKGQFDTIVSLVRHPLKVVSSARSVKKFHLQEIWTTANHFEQFSDILPTYTDFLDMHPDIQTLIWWIVFTDIAYKHSNCNFKIEDVSVELFVEICTYVGFKNCTNRDWATYIKQYDKYNAHRCSHTNFGSILSPSKECSEESTWDQMYQISNDSVATNIIYRAQKLCLSFKYDNCT